MIIIVEVVPSGGTFYYENHMFNIQDAMKKIQEHSIRLREESVINVSYHTHLEQYSSNGDMITRNPNHVKGELL